MKKVLQNDVNCGNINLGHHEKSVRPRLWLRGQAVKTSPFHGGNTGSIPVGVIDGLPRRYIHYRCRCGSIGRAADL